MMSVVYKFFLRSSFLLFIKGSRKFQATFEVSSVTFQILIRFTVIDMRASLLLNIHIHLLRRNQNAFSFLPWSLDHVRSGEFFPAL